MCVLLLLLLVPHLCTELSETSSVHVHNGCSWCRSAASWAAVSKGCINGTWHVALWERNPPRVVFSPKLSWFDASLLSTTLGGTQRSDCRVIGCRNGNICGRTYHLPALLPAGLHQPRDGITCHREAPRVVPLALASRREGFVGTALLLGSHHADVIQGLCEVLMFYWLLMSTT